MRKRILVMLMVVVYAVVLSTSMLAASESKVNALYQEPEMQIRLPTKANLIINPKSSLSERTITSTGYVLEQDTGERSATIVNVPWTIENYSKVGVRVDVQASGTAKGGVVITKSKPKDKDTSKSVYMFLEAAATNPGVDVKTPDMWSSTFDAKKHILVSAEQHGLSNMVALAPVKADGTPSDGGIGAFHLNGSSASDSTIKWSKNDGITVKVVYSFRPVYIPASDATEE